MDPELHAQDVKEKLELFKSYRFNQYAISAVILLNYLFRQYFNFRTEGNAIETDVFVKLDILFALVSLGVFQYITTHDYTDLVDEVKKNTIDWYVTLVIMLIWSRMFIFFLVVPSVSKMLLTLIAMIYDVQSFFMVMVAYLLMGT